MRRLTMLGAPASGKGTQGAMVAEALGVPHVSVGTLLRRSIDEGDPLGVSEFLDQGTLVPDEITQKLLFPNLGEEFVLDGYPRSLQQAVALDEYLDSVGRPLDAAVELVVPDGTLAARLSLRAEEQRRSDDTPDVFLRRLSAYHDEIEKLRDHYLDRLIEVDGIGAEDEVFERIMEAIR